ncbi:hypothetical protein F2Q68_00041191 [Brassica cretica]|uniref:Uncharacterized protein n=2 Tax=Brassica cretica TaxID=69181 RepID=A0ABQ7AIA5_BRACR|nr:hypothetical protein F2Q68_00041191 [Brassica cretica]KAF3497422.1 hypothetical protein DY000_02055629 [Brassica cretica]
MAFRFNSESASTSTSTSTSTSWGSISTSFTGFARSVADSCLGSYHPDDSRSKLLFVGFFGSNSHQTNLTPPPPSPSSAMPYPFLLYLTPHLKIRRAGLTLVSLSRRKALIYLNGDSNCFG